ncbi:MAG: penicillin-binding protein 2, partial [Alphaproteobacteria bacterium]|nr:penicillin-binding protein 2 [Alphaproteobacteria bacterium]
MRRITTVQFDGTAKRALENSRSRVIVTLVLFLAIFGTISMRIVNLGIAHAGPHEQAMPGSVPLDQQRRADIVDRNGMVLATDLETVSLYAEPTQLLNADETAEKLAAIFPDLSAANLALRLRSGGGFVW